MATNARSKSPIIKPFNHGNEACAPRAQKPKSKAIKLNNLDDIIKSKGAAVKIDHNMDSEVALHHDEVPASLLRS